MDSHNDSNSQHTRIAVIGAGIGGISFGIALKRKFPGSDDIVIYEKGDDVGGTWRGCASDISCHFYSLSSDLKADWPTSHPYQPQIYQYWKDLATKYHIYSHVQFNTLVTSVEWNSKTRYYEIITKDLLSKEEKKSTARIVISAVGILEVTKLPEISGISSFKGNIFHSAAWNHEVKLSGKRVAVIGNGASATQFVPVISQDPSLEVVNFCRTPNWFLWPLRTPYNKLETWLFKHFPFWMRIYRASQFFKTELFYFIVFKSALTRYLFTLIAKLYIKYNAPKKYAKELIPNYTMGCKRVIFDTNYLASLHQPNVSLNWDGVESITEDGIITKTGKNLPFDVIICATGFVMVLHFLLVHGPLFIISLDKQDRFPVHVKGTQSTIQEYYDSKSGPAAYMATVVPGLSQFPNFFMLGGPNATTGHSSVVYTEENQIEYILKVITPILKHPDQVHSIDVTGEATDKYNVKLQADIRHSVFVNCASYYRTGKDGKVSTAWPYSATAHWWKFRKVKWGDYKVDVVDTQA
ncbi:hypothetical protein BDP27DRAFT_1518808 [Rhodocollybia butyracea]|uniref:Flavin-containing monooxygenase n=1 Tax=Rhodocollybia butyracea TaxID=206335 RepID=A0A9P5UE85_9AGAR|nr:hypothetical protein BDP27DRAFT_1518808 [Rhodocollybia butyracea]